MRHLVIILTFVAIGAWSSVVPSYADEAPQYGYVDMRKVLLDSKAGQRNKAALEKLVNKKKAQLADAQKKLEALQQAYEKDQLILTDEQKQKRQQEFQEKVQAYQQMAAAAQKDVGEKDKAFTRKAMDVIRDVIAEIAQEKNLALVFEKNEQPVLYAQDGPDLTDLVIERYDAKAGK